MLRIITGRSGSGKTEKLFSLMKSCENSIYIVPEQYSFAAEKKITQAFGMSGMGNPDVFSLRRLAYYFEEMYGGNLKSDISKSGRIMVLYDITKKNAASLSLYGGSARRGDMAQQSAVVITTFKKYGITKEKIQNAMAKTKNTLLYKKLSDCKVIFDAYDAFLGDTYRDADDLLEGLCKNIQRTDYLKGKDIFIDAFQAFTPLEYDVIKNILKKANSVTVALCAHEGLDEFETANRTKNNLIRIAKNEGIEYKGEEKMPGAMFTCCDELKSLENSFFDEDEVFFDKTDKIRLHRAKTEYTEIKNAAREVERLCRDEGYRYRDIVIVARDVEKYERNLTRIFERFDIPLYMDKKTPLSGEAAAIFLLSAIKIISRGWKNESVFEYMKTAFSPLSPHDADELENYCLASGVKRKDWKRADNWDMPLSVRDECADRDFLEKINHLRKTLTAPILHLEEKIKGRHTGRELSVAFYEFMTECGIEEKINT